MSIALFVNSSIVFAFLYLTFTFAVIRMPFNKDCDGNVSRDCIPLITIMLRGQRFEEKHPAPYYIAAFLIDLTALDVRNRLICCNYREILINIGNRCRTIRPMLYWTILWILDVMSRINQEAHLDLLPDSCDCQCVINVFRHATFGLYTI